MSTLDLEPGQRVSTSTRKAGPEELRIGGARPASKTRMARVGIALTVASLAPLVLWGLGQEPGGPSSVLADGPRLTFVGFTRGPSRELIYGARWQTGLARLFPDRRPGLWRLLRGGLAVDPGPFGTNRASYTPGLVPGPAHVLWARRSMVTPNVSDGRRICTLVDDRDTEGSFDWVAFDQAARGSTQLAAVPLGQVPRQQRVLRLRLYSDRTWRGGRLLGELRVPNPLFAENVPKWRCLPLPQTQTNGDLKVTLVRFATRTSEGSGELPCEPGNDPWTDIAFEAHSPSRPGPWRMTNVVFSDAGGNRWRPPGTIARPSDRRTQRVGLGCGLWADEPAYRIELELEPERGSAKDRRTVRFLARQEVLGLRGRG